jgi:hypothetical protein
MYSISFLKVYQEVLDYGDSMRLEEVAFMLMVHSTNSSSSYCNIILDRLRIDSIQAVLNDPFRTPKSLQP